jgi:hypothetical protein
MSKVYLKKIVSSINEKKFIEMDIDESYPYVDAILLTEANYTHSGEKRDYVFDSLIDELREHSKVEIIYIKIDLESKVIKNTNNEKELHFNEKLIRGSFTEYINLNKSDIIFSTDADEILYRKAYEDLIPKLKNNTRKAFHLKLNNFLYSPNNFWININFYAPSAMNAGFYRFNKINQWRYEGVKIHYPYGIHFNWHLTPKEFVYKLNTYAHKNLYSKFADIELIQNSINNLKYPFDNREIEIKKVNHIENPELYPICFDKHVEKFNYLINN